MGLANFPYINEIIAKRRAIIDIYDESLSGVIQRPKKQESLEYNYAYYPVLFKDENKLLKVFDALRKEDIFPRRYFYPSLNNLPYLDRYQPCPISEDISSRIACLPLYPMLNYVDIERICNIIRKTING